MSEEQEWYFISVVDGQQYGPYTPEQLQHYVAAGSVTRETFVWTETLDDWIPASSVEGLFPELAAPHRPRLLTGAAAQAARPLGAAAPAPAQHRQPAAAAMTPPMAAQQVRPAGVPGALPGTVPTAAPVAGALQAAAAGYSPVTAPAPQVVARGEFYPSPGMMKASFGLLVTMCLLGIAAVVGAFVAFGEELLLFGDSGGESSEEAQEASGQSLALFVGIIAGGGIFLLIYRIVTLVYLSRAWKALQLGGVRCTPGKAIGFLFIPLFNLYWLFVAFLGLAKDWNRVMASHPNLAQAPRMSEGLFTTFCIMIVVSALFYLLPPELMKGPIGIIVGVIVLARLVIEWIVYFMICRGVNFMGNLHLMTIQAQQPGVGLRLY